MNYHPTDFAAPTGAVHDFDFLHGDWIVSNRRLKRRFAGCEDWDEFEASFRCEPRLGGGANIDEMQVPDRGFSGMSLRLFDLAARRWAIYWVSSQQGTLFPPVQGGFIGDHGVFVGRDVDGGQPVNVQFFWTRLGPDAARWSQAFSRDGIVWETNWIMNFRRKA